MSLYQRNERSEEKSLYTITEQSMKSGQNFMNSLESQLNSFIFQQQISLKSKFNKTNTRMFM